MSGWLHPAGPESAVTYWARRALVALLLVVVLAVSISVWVGLTSSAAPTTGPGAGTSTTGATAAGSPTTGPTGSASSPPTTSSTPTENGTTTASAPASETPGAERRSTPNPQLTTKPTPVPVTSCVPGVLRTTLQGNPAPKARQQVPFGLSVINGGDVRCRLRLDPTTVELKIYSGVDRIWSTRDCARLVAARTVTLDPQQAVAWRVGWNGRRSAAGCRTRPEIPRPGTYYATFQLRGAEPVQQRMLLHD